MKIKFLENKVFSKTGNDVCRAKKGEILTVGEDIPEETAKAYHKSKAVELVRENPVKKEATKEAKKTPEVKKKNGE